MTAMADKDQDDMLREAARARGFRLVKSRRRKPGGDFGRYGLAALESGRECLGFGPDGLTATAEEVHAYLRGGEVASWKRSLIGVVDAPTAPEPAPPAKTPARPERSRGTRESEKQERTTRSSPKSRRGASAVRSAQPDSPPAFAGGAGGGPSSSPSPSSSKPQPEAPLTIREATRRDAAALARLLAVPAPTLAERLAAAIRAGEPPLVASRAEAIAGVAAWTIIATLDRGPRGRVTLLLVAEDARRQGIGSSLLQGVEERLAEAGVADAELLTGIDFDAPTAFLRRTGYTRRTNGYAKEF
jgi:GNAT superfamily N-acetyltransferase